MQPRRCAARSSNFLRRVVRRQAGTGNVRLMICSHSPLAKNVRLEGLRPITLGMTNLATESVARLSANAHGMSVGHGRLFTVRRRTSSWFWQAPSAKSPADHPIEGTKRKSRSAILVAKAAFDTRVAVAETTGSVTAAIEILRQGVAASSEVSAANFIGTVQVASASRATTRPHRWVVSSPSKQAGTACLPQTRACPATMGLSGRSAAQ